MKKSIRIFVITLAFLATIITCTQGQPKQGHGIYSLETVSLNGVKQTILVTSNDVSKPILLFVHGGPGYSEIALVRKYNKDLDDHFIVVNWDQRGTNLSYDPSIPKASMTSAQIIADGHELIGYLKKKFHRKKIYLLGHSFGTMIAMELAHRYPGDLYAYIGVGQVANMMDNERVSLQFAVDMAQKAGNQKAIAELKAILPYPTYTSPLRSLYTSRRWMDYYGGEVYGQHGPDSLFKGVDNGKNNLYDVKKSAEGLELSMQTLWMPFMRTDLPHTVPELKIPVYFFLGRHDHNVPYTLAEAYFKKLKAPSKTLVFFERSAHMPPFEEPAAFNKAMAKIAAHTPDK